MSGIINKTNWNKLKNFKKRYTGKELYFKICEKRAAPYRDYGKQYQNYLPGEEELKKQRCADIPMASLQSELTQKEDASRSLKISIVVPTYETEERYLIQMIDSVCSQTYRNWELCLVDGSRSDQVKQVLDKKYREEGRIRYRRLEKNLGIAQNTNEGFQMASGDYIGLLDHDDLLVPSALYEMKKRISETGADMLYSDEDKVSADLKEYMDPHFKPEFNRELLLGNNYICHFLVVSQQLLVEVGGLLPEYDGAQDYDFVLRCSEKAEKIEHIAKILYHWRVHPGSTAGNTDSKLYAYEAGKRAVASCQIRQGFNGNVTMLKDLGFYQTRYKVPAHTTVGIYLWDKEHAKFKKVLSQIKSELKRQGCRILMEQESDLEPDFILACSRGITGIKADGVCTLLGNCARWNLAVVGAKTVRKGRVSQCGYQNEEGGFTPRFQNLPKEFKGYFRGAVLASEVDAVTSEFAIMSAKAWKQMKKAGVSPAKKQDWLTWCFARKKSGLKVVVEPQAEVRMGSVVR